jgi:CheY-like chemotaxis protein
VKHLILLADDSPTIQRLVTQTFVDANYEIICVSNGDAAVRKFEDVRPDIVLADIYMPGKNGYEVCDYVKRHAELGRTPVVLLAGAFDAFDENTARQIGASAHITKPFEPRALVELVSSLISASAQASQPAAPAVEQRHEIEFTPAPIDPALSPIIEEPKIAEAAAPAPIPSESPTPSFAAAPVTLTDPVPASEPAPAPPPYLALAPEPAPELAPAAAPVPAPVSAHVPAPAPAESESADLLGLNDLFKPAPAALSVSEAEIERIADRVIQKLSTQVIESVAWDVVPEITTKVLREELKRQS